MTENKIEEQVEENWIMRQLRIASERAALLPQWKRDAAREFLHPMTLEEKKDYLEGCKDQDKY